MAAEEGGKADRRDIERPRPRTKKRRAVKCRG